ncbi:MAG: UpxY family transcription antiterminator [Muribaculaceae bacterium]|nr:UpxY family transcription antiterminator [Muribaculaceae bacterium]
MGGQEEPEECIVMTNISDLHMIETADSVVAYSDIGAHDRLEWFAISAPFRRELQARDYLQAHGLECFLPMRYQLVDAGYGKKKRELRPAVPSMLFVRSQRAYLQQIKKGQSFIQYLTRPEGSRNVPIVVPEFQMKSFMRAIQNSLDSFLYFRPGEIDLRKGRRVRIIGGQLDGVEGVFMRVKGARTRRLVIMLEGLGAVAAEVSPDYVELI